MERFLSAQKQPEAEKGSIIFVLATDGDFSARQLRRLAARVGHGLARTGMISGHSSGDFVIALTTHPAPEASRRHHTRRQATGACVVRDEDMNPFFEAVIEASEEAFIDGVITAATMDGVDGHRVEEINIERLTAALKQAGLIRR